MEREYETPGIADLMCRRSSPYAFSSRPIAPPALASLFEAARWASSSMNEQPWRYVVATQDEPEAFAKMVGALMPGNVPWAEKAPALILAVAKTDFSYNGAPNAAALHDLGAADFALALQAVSIGLITHPMGGFYPEKAREAFGIPEGYAPVAVIAVGYPGDPATLPEPYRERETGPRSRRPHTEFVYRGAWAPPAA
ncbi:MAG TPA: nitroreductase family protein [Armatimonadota bacterium]